MTITREQATAIAEELFFTEIHNGADCEAEHGQEGKPCRYCADLSRLWQARIDQVHNVINKEISK
jgi:hypothetical protein